MSIHPSRRRILTFMVGVLALPWAGAWAQDKPAADKGDFPSPDPIPQVTLGPVLKTHPIQRNSRGFLNPADGNRGVFNEQWVDAAVLPRDRQGIWVLDFAFKPLRIMTVDPGRAAETSTTCTIRWSTRPASRGCFVPQFTLVTDTGKRL